MSYLESREPTDDDAGRFGFKLEKGSGGWRWVAFDGLGRVSDSGQAATRAEAAAFIIRALARA